MKILVLRGGALGDFLLTLPAVAGIRGKWPEATLEMVTTPRFGELVLGQKAVQHLRAIDRPGLAGFYARGGKLDSDWGDYFSEFDLTVSYLFDPDEIFSANWKRAGGTGEFLSIDPRNPREAAWQHFARPLKSWGVEPADASVLHGDELSKGKRSRSAEGAARVVIHPGSGGAGKCWPLERWVQELEILDPRKNFKVIWLAGEAEGDLLDHLPENWKVSPHQIHKQCSLVEVFKIMQSADLYLGHDSGISHLAGWSGARCGILFGPTEPKIWAPPGDHIRTWYEGGRWPGEGELAAWWQGLFDPSL